MLPVQVPTTNRCELKRKLATSNRLTTANLNRLLSLKCGLTEQPCNCRITLKSRSNLSQSPRRPTGSLASTLDNTLTESPTRTSCQGRTLKKACKKQHPWLTSTVELTPSLLDSRITLLTQPLTCFLPTQLYCKTKTLSRTSSRINGKLTGKIKMMVLCKTRHPDQSLLLHYRSLPRYLNYRMLSNLNRLHRKR